VSDETASDSWPDAFAELPTGVRLHNVHAADPAKPLVLLLHGFPEFWYGWRRQIAPLADAGFYVVAPDLRGYNLSSKPPRVRDYRLESLAEDVLALATHLGRARFHLAGHDWGGTIAWRVASVAAERVERLVILNAPHPAAYLRELRRPKQMLRSWYVLFFVIPWLPEALMRSMNFRSLRQLFKSEPARPDEFSEEEIERYVEAFDEPGALRSAINYYRAAVRRPASEMREVAGTVTSPTLLIWGERDRYMIPEMARGSEQFVAGPLRVERFPDSTHWIQHDEAERVTELLIEFLKGEQTRRETEKMPAAVWAQPASPESGKGSVV
jgi:pimeloyl-ACP methyl ester carboxylesterase